MFGNNKDKKTNITGQEELVNKVNQDLVVRNMPNISRLSGMSSTLLNVTNQSDSNTLSGIDKPRHNFKAVGLFIIIGGFILIGAMVYLSYIYIIKPQVKTTTPVALTPAPEKTPATNDVVATATDTLTIATTSLVATVTPTMFDLASSTATSSIDLDQTRIQNTNVTPLVDSDNDGLSDEEEAVLGTNPNSADSNNNTYNDLTEINNNYDPAGTGKIETSANLTKYVNKTIGYEIVYPKSWEAKALGSDTAITFTAPDDSIMQVSTQDNSDHQTISAWYTNSFPDTTITYDKLKSTATWDGIMGDDGLNFYVTDKKHKNIYVISYIPAIDGRLAYPNIFKIMINSFLIK